jgi:hypothetical protein
MAEIVFDGAVISRADREFLQSLDDHPLKQDPRYGAPCPASPDFGEFNPLDPVQTAAREAFFVECVDWMVANYAYFTDAFMGKGGVVSLVDGKVASIASLRGLLQPCVLLSMGPRGGIKRTSVVDGFMMHPRRGHIDMIQTRSDRLRPTFTEDDYTVFNRYRPQLHPAAGGDLAPFKAFLARLFPDETERTWCWHYLAHKARRPWVPMVGVIMVAEDFGSGRGTLFDILELLFGEDYVVPCTFGELTGASASARASMLAWPTRWSPWSTRRSPKMVTSKTCDACITTP